MSCSQVLERITTMAVTFKKFLREPDILGENQLIWIAAILLKYFGLWQFILAKDCLFTLCLRDEYVFDGIPLQSCAKLCCTCLEAMSIFFFTHTASDSSSPSLLHFLLLQQLFCFIAWSQQLMPLIHSCIHKQPQKVTMSNNKNISSSSSYHRSWGIFSGMYSKLTATQEIPANMGILRVMKQK